MKLSDRLKKIGEEKPVYRPEAAPAPSSYQEIKSRVHAKLVEQLDLETIATVEKDRLAREIRSLLGDSLQTEKILLNQKERERLLDEILHEIVGLGPLEPLLQDENISDILVNTANEVYVERKGLLELTGVKFKDNDHLMQIIDRIVSRIGRRIDESSPMVDARLPDGSRVNAIIPPLAIDGPILSIRRFGYHPLRAKDLLVNESMTPEILEFLKGAIKTRLNMLIAGGAGSGKTTLLNILSGFIPDRERIISIEDSAELRLRELHVVRLESRPPNLEGKGEVTQRDLLRNALRMRPDRIIVGEVRGAEVMDMLQAMNTGHDGSLATIHANSPRDALARLEMMVNLSGVTIPERSLRQQMASAITLIIHLSRLSDGKRRIMKVSEIVGMEENMIEMEDIFVFHRKGIDARGTVTGEFRSTGVRPRCIERFEQYGIKLSPETFNFVQSVPLRKDETVNLRSHILGRPPVR